MVYDMTLAVEALVSGREKYVFTKHPTIQNFMTLALRAFPTLR
jgi:hypothetical protein